MENLLLKDNLYHFIGISGIGMSGIALILLKMGYRVSGSDLRETHITRKLKDEGAKIYKGHMAENIKDANIIVISSAVLNDNPEVEEAKKLNIPVVHRSDMLSALMNSKYGIAIAGAHGKTTTTSMISTLLENNGLDPTVVAGGEINFMSSNAKCGSSKYMVVEADESDCSFLTLKPGIEVITNIDVDVNLGSEVFQGHNYDYEKIFKRVYNAFRGFIENAGLDGHIVLCTDCPNINTLLKEIKIPYTTYGFNTDAHLFPSSISFHENTSKFEVTFKNKSLGTFTLNVPGEHNIVNSLATIGVGLKLGIDIEGIREALKNFQGVGRRFQVIGEINNIMVVDDYAHNPTKMRNALAGIKNGWKDRRIIAVFQPHRYSRMKLLGHELKNTFSEADVTIVTDIYSAGEKPVDAINPYSLINIIKENNRNQVIYIPAKEVKEWLIENSSSGDIVITLGAGDITETAKSFHKSLLEKYEQ